MNKVIIITGCSSGFGYHTAKHLAQRGYIVYASVRKKTDLSVFSEIPSKYRPHTFLLDLTWSQKEISQAISKIINKNKRLDVLINNAGFGFLGAIETFNVKQIKEQFDTNFFGTFKVTKAVLPHLRQKRSGLIINVSSLVGLLSIAGYGIYAASKHALEALTQSLRAEESIFGIEVTALNPGSFTTKFWENEKFPQSKNSSLKPLSKFNNKLKKLVNKKTSYRGHPNQVARKIHQIINSKKTKPNYLVGLDAHLIYTLYRILPRSVFSFLIKKFAQKLA